MSQFRTRIGRRAFLSFPLLLGAGAVTVTTASQSGPFHTPEKFGADPSGKEASAVAFINMFNQSLADGIPCLCDRQNAVYRFDRTVTIQTRGRPLSFRGIGASKTRIIIDGWFTGLSVNGTEGREARVELLDFEITRANYRAYDGPVGKRSIEVSQSKGVTISGVNESGSIGFGIFLDRCSDYEISRCTLFDHFTGKTHRSGTDGIHIYRSPGPGRVFDNFIHDVGDDAISFGSFYSNEPTFDFECFGNSIADTSGSIKIYGNARDFRVYRNNVINPKTGGVVVYDDREVAQSFQITRGEIHDNFVQGQIGAGICGGIAIWSPKGAGLGTQSDILIRNNLIVDGNIGITVASQAPRKYPTGVSILNNTIQRMQQRGMWVDRCGQDISIIGNSISDTGFESAFLGQVQDGQKDRGLEFHSNILAKYAQRDKSRYALTGTPNWSVGDNTIEGPESRWRAIGLTR